MRHHDIGHQAVRDFTFKRTDQTFTRLAVVQIQRILLYILLEQITGAGWITAYNVNL
jgi:hypothetical protein